MATYNSGQVKSGTPGTSATDFHSRRLFDFSDRVAELSPEESPFFVYLNKVSKVATTDPVFRFLENRSKIDWTSRDFYLGSSPGAVTANSNVAFTVTDAATAANSIDWLVKGMVFAVETTDGSAIDGADDSVNQVIVRIETSPVDAGTTTTFTGRVLSVGASTSAAGSGGAGSAARTLSDNQRCQVIGTAFGEGTGSPDVWSSEIEDDFGYTQIFKTACEMTNTAIATNYRGYANEWNRLWALKLREHKVDIERAMLFGQRARSNSIQYTEGVIGHIIQNATSILAEGQSGTNLSFNSGAPYLRNEVSTSMTYDVFLRDFEVLYDPARGGSSSKLALASLPVITYFNKLVGGFAGGSMTAEKINYNFDASNRQGAFGHKIMEIDTIHGSMSLIKEPLFRGISSGFLLLADMNKLAYRPLVGNGQNRDTHVITNVQQADEDLRKDMILTEAGLEVSLPEAHALFNFEDKYTSG
jgi:hypothetical protein